MKKIPQPSDDPEHDAPADGKAPAAERVDESSGGPSDRHAARRADAAPNALEQVVSALSGAPRVDEGAGEADERKPGDGARDPGAPAASEAPGGGGASDRGAANRGRPSSSRGGKKTARGPARRFARERALQALYQWDMADAESSTVRREFIERQDMSRVDVDYFERLFRGISHDIDKVDASLADALDRPIAEVDPIERAVLRIAAFELAEVPETPARVVINEGVEITKRFGADNGHRYVNGVLDGLAATLRPREMRRG